MCSGSRDCIAFPVSTGVGTMTLGAQAGSSSQPIGAMSQISLDQPICSLE